MAISTLLIAAPNDTRTSNSSQRPYRKNEACDSPEVQTMVNAVSFLELIFTHRVVYTAIAERSGVYQRAVVLRFTG
jgi:hypothetical protein